MRQHGYRSSFLYGGYGYFDNMNYFYSNNGFEVLDRAAIPNPRFENIWGVADEDLFDRALAHYDEQARSGQPFFSMIMTTSNHKPFTFRPGIPGVKAEGGGRESGVRYADFALGRFLRDARRHAWFDDTLFVVVADHGARVYGRAQIPLRSYEIPLMIYAPAHVQPRTVTALTTQLDIAPTVLGLLGLGYEAPFFGQNVLADPGAERLAFFSHNHDVAVLRNGELAVLGLQKTRDSYRYEPGYEPGYESGSDGQVLGLATDGAPALATVVTVVVANYDLFTLHGVPSSRLSVPLQRSNLALARASFHVRTLHPQLYGLGFYWYRGRDEIRVFQAGHDTRRTDMYRLSPMRLLFDDGVDEIRQSLEIDAAGFAFPLYGELKAEGLTDYLALPLTFSDGKVHGTTWSSDRKGGFTDAEVGLIKAVLPAFGLLIEIHLNRRIAVNLLDAYVGHRAGERILSGQITRGSGETIPAAIWFSDLRGFTAMSETTARDELLDRLNQYFDAIAGPVSERGGEILKFIGDAVLAIFRSPTTVPARGR
ncbi:MAG: sulfatase-like hydrolase/transferase, partial [Gammaproteobacteria bacterium]|nr:sulfatase-like hydrolase/transferase [Gammaproteobacteria bacterium]